MNSLFSDALLAPKPREIRPGAVHIPSFLSIDQQSWIIGQYRSWRQGPLPAHHPRIGQHRMSVQTLPLGWHWTQHGYRKRAKEFGDVPPLQIPEWVCPLAREAIKRAQEITSADLTPDGPFEPDILLANYYAPTAQMGMHQDAHERLRAPIVSFSIGDSCLFRLGNTQTSGQPYDDVRLASGDLFVFGGPLRQVFHGVPKLYPGTAPRGVGLSEEESGPGGRINLTIRQTGLEAAFSDPVTAPGP